MEKIPPVSFGDLKGIFTSRNFTGALKKSTEISLRIGFENQFSFWREVFSGKVRYSPIPESTYTDSFDSTYFGISEELAEKIIDKNMVPLIRYHCHGIFVCPSENDLALQLVGDREYSDLQIDEKWIRVTNLPIYCIGVVGDGGGYRDILVFQNRSRKTIKSDAEFVSWYLYTRLGRRTDDNLRVTETLDALPDWEATLIRYERINRAYKILESELSKLEKFAYPIKCEEIDDEIDDDEIEMMFAGYQKTAESEEFIYPESSELESKVFVA